MSTSNWYYVESSLNDVKELESMFWTFHDFRISDIHYVPRTDSLDVLFEYDDHSFWVLLRFIGEVQMNLLYSDDYEADWIGGSTFLIDKNNKIIWIENEIENESKISMDTMWIKSKYLRYAIINKNGDTVPIPEHIIHQKYKTYNFYTRVWEYSEKTFSPKVVNSDLL